MRHKDINWSLAEAPSIEGGILCVLMDIRDELKKLNEVFNCRNFLSIPMELRGIRRDLKKRKK